MSYSRDLSSSTMQIIQHATTITLRPQQYWIQPTKVTVLSRSPLIIKPPESGEVEGKRLKIKRMLRAGFKPAEVSKILGVSIPYIYVVRDAKDIPAKFNLVKAHPDESLQQLMVRNRKEKFLLALFETRGVALGACEMTGIEYNTHLLWKREDPEFLRRCLEVKEASIDYVETILNKLITKENPKAVTFYLERMGRDRGWGKELAITGKDGGAIEVRVIEPSVDISVEEEDNIREAEYEVIEP